MSRFLNKNRLGLRKQTLLGTAMVLLVASFGVSTPEPEPEIDFVVPELPGTVHGTLRVSVHTNANETDARAAHSVVYRRGLDYDGVADSEIRGYMDGGVKYVFNQAHQVHLRVGRRSVGIRHGEYELKRFLMLWRGISIPAGAVVEAALLVFTIEIGAPAPFSLYLYPVKKEWGPGFGGVSGNNNDVPRPGSVWRRDARNGEQAWALPGCSFASDDHQDADTSANPIAEARYRPGDQTLVFERAGLADYVAKQAAAGDPINVMVKAADAAEDVPGQFYLTIYSSEIDDNRITKSRPALSIRWNAAATHVMEQRLMLEHGRRYLSPWFRCGRSATIAASL